MEPQATKPRKKRVWLVVGLTLGVFVVLSLFDPSGPFGCATAIWSYMPPHSRIKHGSTPPEFEGIWVQMDAEEYSTAAFALHKNGEANLWGGMVFFRWHYDDDRLFLESWTRCGSCWQGTTVREYAVVFDGVDRLTLSPQHESRSGFSNPVGTFERITVTDELKERLQKVVDERDYESGYEGSRVSGYILRVIEQSEFKGYDYSEEEETDG